MTAVTYTARNSLLPNHSAATLYELELRLISADPTGRISKTEQESKSLSRRETLFWGKTNGLSITVGSYAEVSHEFDALLEFLDSVETGEPFTFDRFGSPGVPIEPRVVVMRDTYQTNRYAQRAGHGNDLMRFSFTIEFS